jgi:outer membrane murein-binding lipoprotein Lpp
MLAERPRSETRVNARQRIVAAVSQLMRLHAGREDQTIHAIGKQMALAATVLVAGTSLAGCATKDYVNERVAAVSQRVDALEARVNQVDQTAQSAGASAQQANQRLDQLTARVDSIEQRLAAKPARN